MAQNPFRRGSQGYFSDWDQRRPSRDFTGGNDPYTNYRGRHGRDYEDPGEYRSSRGYGDQQWDREYGSGRSGREEFGGRYESRNDYGSRYDQGGFGRREPDYDEDRNYGEDRDYGSFSNAGYGNYGGSGRGAYGGYGSSGSYGGSSSDYSSRYEGDRGSRGYGRSPGNYDWDRESSGSGGRDRFGFGMRGGATGGYDYDRPGRYSSGRSGDPYDNRGGRGEDRDWWERTGDEISSWFGDEEAKRRREMDRRESHRGKGPRGYQRSDERIKEDISDRFSDDALLDATDIDIKVEKGEVTLSGKVASRIYKRRAEDIAESVSGVRNVENRIRVGQDVTSESTPGGYTGSATADRGGVTSTSASSSTTQNASDRNKLKQTT